MKVSLNWIREFVSLPEDENIALALTMKTAEVEQSYGIFEYLDDVVVVKVVDIKKHPNSDKLYILIVNDGSQDIQVVAGVKNYEVGDKLPLAKIGAKLPDITIKKAKLRGVESNGMLCSEKELGLGDDHSGIMLLDRDIKEGTPLSQIFPYKDTIIEIDNKSLTHRPDLWGHYGFAREIATIYKRDLKPYIDRAGFENAIKGKYKKGDDIKVVNEDEELCPRYSALKISNVKIEESPSWLKAKIISAGLRPINNIVDITNIVMLELGQPLHAFDRKKINGNTIYIRRAKDGEKIITLDDKERILNNNDIVIADRDKAIALAGVMGGRDSEISDETTDIVLESANFDPTTIRKTANRLALRTDAAVRFEKSLDPEYTLAGIYRATQLILKLCPDAYVSGDIVDVYPKKHLPGKIVMEKSIIDSRLALNIPEEEIKDILTRLGFGFKIINDGIYEVEIPTFRATKDVEIYVDIIEEIGRIYGYEKIKDSPPAVLPIVPEENLIRKLERRIKQIMSFGFGFSEVYNYSFTSREALVRCFLSDEDIIALKNPLSSKQNLMRNSMLVNLIKNTADNLRFFSDFKIYEVGRTYHKSGDNGYIEKYMLAGCIVDTEKEEDIFYLAKDAIKKLIDYFGVEVVFTTNSGVRFMHPARFMHIVYNKKQVGLFGEIHPKVASNFDIKRRVGYFELEYSFLKEFLYNESKFDELERYPSVPFEISVIADEREEAKNIVDIIKEANLVKEVKILSVYKGSPIPVGKKSVSLFIRFYKPDGTIDGQEARKLQDEVIARIKNAGYSLR